jgi:serine/threonine-protein kinase
VVSSGRELRVVDLGDGTETPLLTDVVRAWYAPTGHVIYVRVDGAVFAQPFDLSTLELSGGAIPLLDGVRTTAVRADMRLAPDGTVLYVEGGTDAGGGARLAIQDLEGGQALLPLGPRAFTVTRPGPGWSPDGESVVFETEGQIYTYNTVLNTTPRQITFEGVNIHPVYSPDGTRVVFSSLRPGTDELDLFVKDLTDDAPPRSLITLDASQISMGWPTDTLLVFEQDEGGARDLWTLDLSDPDEPEARPYLTSEADLQYVAVSPDERHAAYRSDESGALEIYIRSFPDPGGQTVVSQGGGEYPFWSPDGNTLYYYTGSGGPWIAANLQRGPVLSVVALDTLFANPTLAAQPVPTSFHPDGDRWIVAVPGSVPQNEDAPRQRLILIQNFFEELRRLTGT